MRTFFLAWRNPVKKLWFPIGRLTCFRNRFEFVYVKGVVDAQESGGFQPLLDFQDLDAVYESDDLFPLFSNRLPRRSRQDYKAYVEWLNVPEDMDDPLVLLARNAGRRETDTFEVFPSPSPGSEGDYHLHFFAHGLSHFPKAALERIERLKEKDSLLVFVDIQNPVEQRAIGLRTNDIEDNRDRSFAGWCPRYLLDDDVLDYVMENPEAMRVTVERMNPPPAPLRLRLLCGLTLKCPEGIRLFSSEPYQPYAADLLHTRG